jgi:PIN domain nuclease of toxin-antitoxin system
MSRVAFDASALLAVLAREPGWEEISSVLPGAVISAVNLCEVVGKLTDRGMPGEAVAEALGSLGLDIVAFDAAAAHRAGLMKARTARHGLSLGDRACLALAQELGLTAVTTDGAWREVRVGVEIRVVPRPRRAPRKP